MATTGHGNITHWTVGTAASSTGKILFVGAVTPNISIAVGVTPVITTASAITVSGAGDTFENDIAKLILNATAIANIADNASASPLTNLYIALHTADPTGAGSQTTSEANYTGYARKAVPRNSSGFTISGSVGNLTSNVSFDQVQAD